ncbi:hypothetical protein Tco_0859800 [Tanacetum coccineum]|uniref:Uncharacterized protein n=1 Tax=Tanacetum coccineum TaxID=301880 RepID=A0ABQ5BDZ9_9ASTR
MQGERGFTMITLLDEYGTANYPSYWIKLMLFNFTLIRKSSMLLMLTQKRINLNLHIIPPTRIVMQRLGSEVSVLKFTHQVLKYCSAYSEIYTSGSFKSSVPYYIVQCTLKFQYDEMGMVSLSYKVLMDMYSVGNTTSVCMVVSVCKGSSVSFRCSVQMHKDPYLNVVEEVQKMISIFDKHWYHVDLPLLQYNHILYKSVCSGPEPMEIDSKSSSSLIPNSDVTILEGHASKEPIPDTQLVREIAAVMQEFTQYGSPTLSINIYFTRHNALGAGRIFAQGWPDITEPWESLTVGVMQLLKGIRHSTQ